MSRYGYLLPLIFCSIQYGSAFGQMPITNVVLIEYEWENDSMHIKNHTTLTSGNGYNNQPSFSDDCKSVYFTSNRKDSTNTDLYRVKLRNFKTIVISDHALSEYSPTPDLSNGNSIWHVRVEADKKQHLRRTVIGCDTASNMCPASDSVGYFIQSDGKDIGLIMLNNGLEFHTYTLGSNSTELVHTNTGRFLNYDATDNSYVFHGYQSTGDYLYRYDRKQQAVVDSIIALYGCKDYGMDKNGYIYGGADGMLFRNSFHGHGKWKPVADLRPYIDAFYRLSFCKCGMHICLVTYVGNKP